MDTPKTLSDIKASERGIVIAEIALALPCTVRSADVLLALHKAFEAGERQGFANGCVAGQNHVASAIGMLQRARA